jgi:hypothetical protein
MRKPERKHEWLHVSVCCMHSQDRSLDGVGGVAYLASNDSVGPEDDNRRHTTK